MWLDFLIYQRFLSIYQCEPRVFQRFLPMILSVDAASMPQQKLSGAGGLIEGLQVLSYSGNRSSPPNG